jgi:cell division protein FtsB
LLLCTLSFYAGLLRNLGIAGGRTPQLQAQATGYEERSKDLEREVKVLRDEIERMKREKDDHDEEHHAGDGDGGGVRVEGAQAEVKVLRAEIQRMKREKEDHDEEVRMDK